MTPTLSVVMPAHNEGASISAAIDTVCAVLAEEGMDYEIVVVSDGSTDNTVRVARAKEEPRVRVVDYAPNMGKGTALARGSRVARGTWVAWLDADLDLSPSSLVPMLALAKAESLDAVVGSKRHPESIVDYPRGRRVGSGIYQTLIRLLFGLRVRDTQVGIKVFRREVLDAVLPRVVVKRYAFDLEVLAVARRIGFDEVREAPVILEYQFSGSGIGLHAVCRALWDTAAIFYRLRIIRYYDS